MGEATHITEKDRFVVNRLVYSIFVPIFFANIGLHLNFITNFDLPLVLLISAIGIGARFTAAYLGSRWSKQHTSNLPVIAIAHTPGGEMHIVVSMLAYSSGLISERILVSIISASLLSTIIFGPGSPRLCANCVKASSMLFFANVTCIPKQAVKIRKRCCNCSARLLLSAQIWNSRPSITRSSCERIR
ncbi:MAG: cation:proton antiporter [Candidatus Cloacimonetes bacterium]|nr:cation:proton antiporter [Candidatus Cloacimonadota bacterium]